MFETLSQAAARAAVAVSRRQFLQRFGQASLVAAAGLGAALVFPEEAAASPCPKGTRRVKCLNYNARRLCCPTGKRCYCDYDLVSGFYCYCA